MIINNKLYQIRTYRFTLKMAEEEGFEPSVQVSSHGHLANDWFKPLTHSSLYLLTHYTIFLNR